jgi:PleD family two-component response regulator
MIDYHRNATIMPPALALIVSANDWNARAIETILDPADYVTLRATTNGQAVQFARSASPDVVIVYGDLLDAGLAATCHALLWKSFLSPACPVIVISSNGGPQERRLELQRLGVWHIMSEPVNAEALALLLERLLGAQRELRRVSERILIDAETGLYNERGLLRRAHELGAHATRSREALSCIALRLVVEGEDNTASEAVTVASLTEHLAAILGPMVRLSDAIGRLRPRELGVVAAGASEESAFRLIGRMRSAVESSPMVVGGAIHKLSIAAALCAVPDFSQSAVSAQDLLCRVADLLRNSTTELDRSAVRVVEAVPLRSN